MHNNFVVAVVAALTLGNVASSVKGDCSQLDYCGGAHGDLNLEIKCTPFPAKNMGLPPYQWQSYCDHEDVRKYAGSSNGAKAWQYSGADNYWVFHGCDGAGLMDDCMGGTGYIEQFGPYSAESTPLTRHTCGDGWENHCSQPFVHPGTGKVYKWYNAGMWTWGGGNWPDKLAQKKWWDNMGLPDTDQLDNGPGTAFAVMYPWVCGTTGGEDVTWLWGSEESWQNQLPYGDETYDTKCYYDNEPWDIGKTPNAHWTSTLIPPIWQAYKFYYDENTQKVTGWLLAEKKAESPTPELYYLTGSPEFLLQSSGRPPWMTEE
jgi:hypothetical protein